MAFIPLEDRLQLRVNVGTVQDPVYRTRSWNNVKPGVSDAVLHDFAEALGDLTAESVEKFFRVKIGELAEE
ncbi:MAG: DUF1659 domain-containing protein [Bacillota bacterium]